MVSDGVELEAYVAAFTWMVWVAKVVCGVLPGRTTAPWTARAIGRRQARVGAMLE